MIPSRTESVHFFMLMNSATKLTKCYGQVSCAVAPDLRAFEPQDRTSESSALEACYPGLNNQKHYIYIYIYIHIYFFNFLGGSFL